MNKLLFTPGPLTTNKSVKEATLYDFISSDFTFKTLVRKLKEHLLYLTGVSREQGYDVVVIQGSGTYSIESVLCSTISSHDHLLILINGVYGERFKRISELCNIKFTTHTYEEDEIPNSQQVRDILVKDPSISHIAMVHCETTTGIINPISEIGSLCNEFNKLFIVDAMSTFGAIPIHMNDLHIDFLISSSNKCIDGIPGFAFVVTKTTELRKSNKLARNLTFDLHAQWKRLEKNGKFRITPPVQAILAFNEALEELYEEGGIEARASRYRRNCETLLMGMAKLGFKTYLSNGKRSYIITSFLYPDNPNFEFHRFYSLLNKKGFVIYPGKLSNIKCFRIRTIGHLNNSYFVDLLIAIEIVLREMECFPLQY
jgi:2-aminoethylphosphonate-pyruvate transaminase